MTVRGNALRDAASAYWKDRAIGPYPEMHRWLMDRANMEDANGVLPEGTEVVQVTLTPTGDGSWRAWVDGPEGRADTRVTYGGPLEAAALALEVAGYATAADVSRLRRTETVFVGSWSDGALVGSDAELTVALCAECASPLGGRVKLVGWNRDAECGQCGKVGSYYEVLTSDEPEGQ